MKTLHLYIIKAKVWAKQLGYKDKKYLRFYIYRAFESRLNKTN